MNLDFIKEQRGLSFVKVGMKVELCYSGKTKVGKITGGNASGNIDVKFEGENKPQNCHPCWAMKYFDDSGYIIREFPE